MSIRHDGTITCRCETCVSTQLAEQGPMRRFSDGTLTRYDRMPMSEDNVAYLSEVNEILFGRRG